MSPLHPSDLAKAILGTGEPLSSNPLACANQLRGVANADPVLDKRNMRAALLDAAAEIDRLTALDDVQCERMADMAKTIERLTSALHEATRREATLTAELASLKQSHFFNDYGYLRAERDRLRAQLALYKSQHDLMHPECLMCQQEQPDVSEAERLSNG